MDPRRWKMLPQPAQRGQRGDQVANVIQLHRKDAFDFVTAEQRLAGADQSGRLGIGAVFVGQLGQPGAEVGIARRVERPPLFGEMACVEYVVDIRTARELMVDQLGVRRIDNRQTRLPGSQTEIYIIVEHRMRLIEPAETVKHVAAHQHAGAGDGCDVPLGQGQSEVAGIVLGQEPKGMAACAERGQEYPGMLDLAVGIEQLRADNANLGPLSMLQQGIQPVLPLHLDIVIEEQQVLPGGLPHSSVVEARPVECLRDSHDLVGAPCGSAF